MTDGVRDRIMDGVVDAVRRSGLAGFALEDVAATAGVARATIYRHFPGGRAELVREAVTREVGRFWLGLAAAVSTQGTLEDRLVLGVMEARRRILDDELLQRLLSNEADELLPALAESESLVNTVIEGYIEELLAGEHLRVGSDRRVAAGYLSRLLQSYMASPGRWDLTDEVAVRRLVRTQFLAGILDTA